MFFRTIAVNRIVDSLGFMCKEFQSRYIGVNRWLVKDEVLEYWKGCEVAEGDDTHFLLRNKKILRSFVFKMISPDGLNGDIRTITIFSKDYPNILIAVNEQARNFIVTDEASVTKAENQFCRAMLDSGHFLKGKLK